MKDIKFHRKIAVLIPDIKSHMLVYCKDAGILQRIDTELVSKIDTFVRQGVTGTREMKRLLKIIVKTEIFKNEKVY